MADKRMLFVVCCFDLKFYFTYFGFIRKMLGNKQFLIIFGIRLLNIYMNINYYYCIRNILL